MKRRIWSLSVSSWILSRAWFIVSSVASAGSLPWASITRPTESRISVKNPILPLNSGSKRSLILVSSRPVTFEL